MGIKRKILLGFISIGSLLLLSGIISTMELVRFNRSTYKLLERNRISIELSKKMLDAVQEHNTTLLMNVLDSVHYTYDSVLAINKAQLDSAYTAAIETFKDSPKLAMLRKAGDDYTQIVAGITDTTTVAWFSDVYKTSYYNLTNAIKDFMVHTQNETISYTAELKSGAYRATMVGIIALAAGLFLMILFYYMINNFLVSPVLKIQKSLNRHLEHKMPFDVTISTKDEIKALKLDITKVIEKAKK